MFQMRLAEINCNSEFLQQEVDDAERKVKENKEKIAHIEQDINDTMEGVRGEIKAARLAGVSSSSSSGNGTVRAFSSAEDETDNATLSMVGSDEEESY